MMVSRNIVLTALVAAVAAFLPLTNGFVPQSSISLSRATPAFIFGGGKKDQEDFSDIEVRDLTREEMLEINKQNEDVMNMELGMMTAFSLVISIPILYLCWVAFFSE